MLPGGSVSNYPIPFTCPPIETRDDDLWIEDCRLVDLAAQFGTPLHLVSERRLRENARSYIEAFTAVWPGGNVLVLPAIKANHSLALRRILTEERTGCDVFSEGE